MIEAENEKMLGIPDVAKMLGVSEPTVRRLIHDRQLTATRVGVQWRIMPKAVEWFKANNTMQAITEVELHV